MADKADFDMAYCVSARLVWRTGDSLEPQFRDQGVATTTYVGKIGKARPGLIRGDIDVLAVLRTWRGGWPKTNRIELTEVAPLRNAFAAISARGGAVRLVMGLDVPRWTSWSPISAKGRV